jgi:hypothetical protein
MKKILISASVFFCFLSYSQEHFTGLTTSSRVGLLNVGINPAEIVNMNNAFEVNLLDLSFNIQNNKIGFKDITDGSDLKSLIFKGDGPVNLRVAAEVYGPGVAFKLNNWGFAISSKANIKLDVIDVDSKLGDAIVNANYTNLLTPSIVTNNYNQRVNATTWGEVGLTISRSLVDNDSHKFNVGGTFKLLFPSAYANMGLNKFNGEISSTGGQTYITNVNDAELNIAYSGSLANNFTNFNDYSKKMFGGLNGFAGDIGVNYQWKGNNNETEDNNTDENAKPKVNYNNKYKINVGATVQNIGTMTFKDDNNYSTNYNLNIPDHPYGLNLNQFSNTTSIKDIENVLISDGYLTKKSGEKNFVIKLPTTFSVYADVKIISKLYLSGFLQRRLNDNNENTQITAQNLFTVTPRINLGFFEAYVPISNTEVSGFNTGVGFRLGGFYIGSGSIVSALLSDTKKADFYTGFRWAFL